MVHHWVLRCTSSVIHVMILSNCDLITLSNTHYSCSLQLVHPAFQAMLGHIRTKVLDKFKNDLEQSLKTGKGFAASIHDCIQSSLLEFDQECDGNIPIHLYRRE